MLKISPGAKEPRFLRLEGTITGPWVEELERTCQPLTKSTLALDLAEVTFADDHGAALLADLKSRGAKLLNVSPFVAEQLRAIQQNYP